MENKLQELKGLFEKWINSYKTDEQLSDNIKYAKIDALQQVINVLENEIDELVK